MGWISILSANYAVKRKILREKNLVRAGIRTGVAGWEARLLHLCYAAPSSNVFIQSVIVQILLNRFCHKAEKIVKVRFSVSVSAKIKKSKSEQKKKFFERLRENFGEAIKNSGKLRFLRKVIPDQFALIFLVEAAPINLCMRKSIEQFGFKISKVLAKNKSQLGTLVNFSLL